MESNPKGGVAHGKSHGDRKDSEKKGMGSFFKVKLYKREDVLCPASMIFNGKCRLDPQKRMGQSTLPIPLYYALELPQSKEPPPQPTPFAARY